MIDVRALAACDARLYRFVAGAGFGKTTLAWELARRRAPVSACDLLGVRSEIDAWRRLITALAKLDPAHGERIIQESLTLALADATDRHAYLSTIASRAAFRGTLLVDNAESLSHNRQNVLPLAALLSGRPSCTVIVCSRSDLALRPAKTYAPHEFVTVRERDLRFGLDDFQRSLEGGMRGAAAERALAWSGGWPLAAARAIALLRDGRELPAAAAGETWLCQLVVETMDAVSEDLRDALSRLAASSDPAAGEMLRANVTAIPFLTERPDGSLELHPLAREELLRLYPEACERARQAVVADSLARGDHLRIAELALQHDDLIAAADALERVDHDYYQMPSPRYVAVLERLDRELVIERPGLWMVCEICLQSDFLPVTEGLDPVLRAKTDAIPVRTRMACAALICFRKAEYHGEWEQASTLLDDFERSIAPARPQPRDALYPALFRASVASNCGWDFDEAAFWREYGEELFSSNYLLGEYLYLKAPRSLFRGDAQRVLSALDRYVEVMRASGQALQVRAALYRALALPWELDAREPHERYRRELIELLNDPVTPNDLLTRLAWEMLDASQGVSPFRDGPVLATGCLTNLMIAASSDDFDEASAAMRRAVEMSASRSLRLIAVLLRVAAFSFDPSYEELLDTAFANFRDSACPSLRAAVQALRSGADCGILEPFAKRFRAAGHRIRDGLFVDVTLAAVRRGGAQVHLGDRELELLVLLATAGRPLPALDVAEMMWPQSDDAAARNALKVCISRIRSRTGCKDAIVTTAGDITLGAAQVQTDIARIERLLRLAEQGSAAALSAVRAILERPLPQRYGSWRWADVLYERWSALRVRAVTPA